VQYERIDRLTIPIADLEAALEPFRRLGVSLLPATNRTGGATSSGFVAGGEGNRFQVELLRSDAGANAAPAVVLATSDLEAAVATLRARGLETQTLGQTNSGDSQAVHQVGLRLPGEAGAAVRLVQASLSGAQRSGSTAATDASTTGTLLKRLDHLAVQVQDLDASCAFWEGVLGVPLYGEVRSPVTIVRQFKIGDAMIELLAPTTPEAAAAPRQLGLARMAAFEVADMTAAVAQARSGGFTVADPVAGTLPGTRVTMIPAAELSGLRLQLLEYV
jgi:catechol 2,3-dioxygenase-like lactoylglutathione lyase family enzyme